MSDEISDTDAIDDRSTTTCTALISDDELASVVIGRLYIRVISRCDAHAYAPYLWLELRCSVLSADMGWYLEDPSCSVVSR